MTFKFQQSSHREARQQLWFETRVGGSELVLRRIGELVHAQFVGEVPCLGGMNDANVRLEVSKTDRFLVDTVARFPILRLEVIEHQLVFWRRPLVHCRQQYDRCNAHTLHIAAPSFNTYSFFPFVFARDRNDRKFMKDSTDKEMDVNCTKENGTEELN